MNFELTTTRDYWELIGLCAVFGAAGAIAYDLTEPVRSRIARKVGASTSEDVPFGDDRLVLPSIRKRNDRKVVEAGFLGPVLVGMVAAVVAVFFLGIKSPSPPSAVDVAGVVKVLTDKGVPATTRQAVRDKLKDAPPDYVDWKYLVGFALVGGFGSVLVLRTARTRLIDLLGTAKLDGRVEGAEQVKKAVKKAVTQQAKPARERAKAVGQAASDPAKASEAAVTQHSSDVAQIVEQVAEAEVSKLANSSPWGNPPPPGDWGAT